MKISIRDYIKDNFKEASLHEIEESIDASIEKKEEITLPGLGVFFELLWTSSNKKQKNEILQSLRNKI